MRVKRMTKKLALTEMGFGNTRTVAALTADTFPNLKPTTSRKSWASFTSFRQIATGAFKKITVIIALIAKLLVRRNRGVMWRR